MTLRFKYDFKAYEIMVGVRIIEIMVDLISLRQFILLDGIFWNVFFELVNERSARVYCDYTKTRDEKKVIEISNIYNELNSGTKILE